VDTFYPLSLSPDLPFATQQRIHSMRTSTPDLQILPTLGRGFSSASSPRSRYILGCLEKRLNPRASLLIRKSLSGELNLKHMGIGDSMAIELTSALTELPFLHTVDISENSLGDEGLVAMLNAFSCMPGLTALNSQTMRSNPEALGYLVSSKNCNLKKMILRRADVDDFEGERFVRSLEGNTTIEELDLSYNKIGHAEVLNTVYPDLTTALSDLPF
jgi:hypothetical protein